MNLVRSLYDPESEQNVGFGASHETGFSAKYGEAQMRDDISGLRRKDRMMRPEGYADDPRIREKYKQYSFNPLDTSRATHKKWVNTVLDGTNNSKWLDELNNENRMGMDDKERIVTRDIDDIKPSDLNNPHLARLLASFRVQDMADAELGEIERAESQKQSESEVKSAIKDEPCSAAQIPTLPASNNNTDQIVMPSEYLKDITAPRPSDYIVSKSATAKSSKKKGKIASFFSAIGNGLKKLKFW